MSTPPLSFERASYAGESASAAEECAYCKRSILDEYFRVGPHMACLTCARKAQSLIPPNSHGAFARAVSFGAAAAVLGCIVYALLVIVTGWTIGYAAIGVGYVVGRAMKLGARGNGGRRYQVAAALLTYAAVAMAFIPIVLHETEGRKGPATTQTATARSDGAAKTSGVEGFVIAVGELVGLGLISPFLELAGSVGSGLLNLFIIFIGARFAWISMAPPRVDVEGPYAMEVSQVVP